MIYCDTSLLVSVLVPEATSPAARAWYFTSSRARCGVSPWTITEVASALARKHRNGLLDDAQRQIVEHGWSAMQAELDQLPIRQRHFRQAAALVDVAPRGLRSGDALHLAIAIDQGCQLATFDRDLGDAARERGIVVHPV